VTDGQLSYSEVGFINVEAAVFRGRFFVTSAPPTPFCLGKREHVDTDPLRYCHWFDSRRNIATIAGSAPRIGGSRS
jgi:hypothetical protein